MLFPLDLHIARGLQWHSLAKLHSHTGSTTDELLEVTKQVEHLLRKLKKSACAKYITKELPSEVNACGRRKANRSNSIQAPTKHTPWLIMLTMSALSEQQITTVPKRFDINLYSGHRTLT